ncbi:hypothetical protein [Streptomyces sp. NRRL F-2580]|nr:hypothetical protein [Streptomyces sp. NRRL F-2580]
MCALSHPESAVTAVITSSELDAARADIHLATRVRTATRVDTA